MQLLFATGKSFTVDGLREKLREFFWQEVRAELRAALEVTFIPFLLATRIDVKIKVRLTQDKIGDNRNRIVETS
jgi:hypothetical protein